MLRRLPYAGLIVLVTFLVLLAAAGVRAAPGVLIRPLEAEFGWDRASISLAIAVSILAFGLGAPLSGGLIDRFGPKRVMLGGLVLIVGGLIPLALMTELWQLHLFWGSSPASGPGRSPTSLAPRSRCAGSGPTAASSSACSRRLRRRASSSSSRPSMAIILENGWRTAIAVLAAAVGVDAPARAPVDARPAGRRRTDRLRGDGDAAAEAADRQEAVRTTSLRDAARTRDFWLLAGSFFICGYTSNGLIGTHLIPHAVEHGFTEVTAASAVALMGTMNIVGTLASGWLTDRYDNRRLLAAYYGFRALSIAALPLILVDSAAVPVRDRLRSGLDRDGATDANLTARIYGRGSLGTIYGWIFASHMAGAALAAFLGGYFHDVLGDYHAIFISAALIGFLAVLLASRISVGGLQGPKDVAAATPAPAV